MEKCGPVPRPARETVGLEVLWPFLQHREHGARHAALEGRQRNGWPGRGSSTMHSVAECLLEKTLTDGLKPLSGLCERCHQSEDRVCSLYAKETECNRMFCSAWEVTLQVHH